MPCDHSLFQRCGVIWWSWFDETEIADADSDQCDLSSTVVETSDGDLDSGAPGTSVPNGVIGETGAMDAYAISGTPCILSTSLSSMSIRRRRETLTIDKGRCAHAFRFARRRAM